MKKSRTVLLLFVLFASNVRLAQRGISSTSAANVCLSPWGQSIVAPQGPWMFQIGGHPAWTIPDFDDSGW